MPGWEVIGEEERRAVDDIFATGAPVLFAHGFDKQRSAYRVRDYERAFAAHMGAQYAQAVSSGSAALKIALQALGIGPSDEVITQAFTFVATVEAILEVGATPVIVDIDKTLNMDPDALLAAITPRTKCIIPVHMMGECCPMSVITGIAIDRGIPVVEDAAQALGASYYGNAAGTIGTIGCYSTDAGKTICTGEGGMIVTNITGLYENARAYHDHGHAYERSTPRGEDHAICRGFNYRMTELQGAIGLAQLAKLDSIVEWQRENFLELQMRLMDRDFPIQWRNSICPEGSLGDTMVFFLPNAGKAIKFAQAMQNKGLATKNLPDAMRWHFAGHWSHLGYGYSPEQWAKSISILECAIAIPINIKMDVERTAETLLAIGREVL